MNSQLVALEIGNLLSGLVTKMRGAAALGMTDPNKYAETLLLELLREIYDLPHLRNLNAERRNFPALDLGDDSTGRAFQITATPDLVKVKDTLRAVRADGLHKRFPHVQIYVLTEKQASYSQAAIDQVLEDAFVFDGSKDILDYRDLLSKCAHFDLDQLIRVRDILLKHLSPTHSDAEGFRARSYFPIGQEPVELNLLQIWLPRKLYLADFIAAKSTRSSRRRSRRPLNPRTTVVKELLEAGRSVPEDFEVFDTQLVSFQDLNEPHSPLARYFDAGTVADLAPQEFYDKGDDELRVFKSLLRRRLQRQLSVDKISWQHEEQLFYFCPDRDPEIRKVSWRGERMSERVVFQRTMKTNKPDEVLTCKHLAFKVAFHVFDKQWYLSITPTWFFSRDGYRTDGFASKRISWLKRKENDQQVANHLRFIVSRLHTLQSDSLFERKDDAHLHVGDPVSFANHPLIPDDRWRMGDPEEKEDVGEQGMLL